MLLNKLFINGKFCTYLASGSNEEWAETDPVTLLEEFLSFHLGSHFLSFINLPFLLSVLHDAQRKTWWTCFFLWVGNAVRIARCSKVREARELFEKGKNVIPNERKYCDTMKRVLRSLQLTTEDLGRGARGRTGAFCEVVVVIRRPIKMFPNWKFYWGKLLPHVAFLTSGIYWLMTSCAIPTMPSIPLLHCTCDHHLSSGWHGEKKKTFRSTILCQTSVASENPFKSLSPRVGDFFLIIPYYQIVQHIFPIMSQKSTRKKTPSVKLFFSCAETCFPTYPFL